MDNQEIQERIQQLVERERELRESGNGGAEAAEVQAELRKTEESLDQCWDLLRQRRAKQEMGENPDDVSARPVEQVETYRQ